MGAATKFDGKARYINDSHPITILFAKHRHGAFFLRFVKRHFLFGDFDVVKNLLVHLAFNLAQLLRFNPLKMGKVKAQTVRAHIASGLAHMGAQHLPQGRVQKMRSRVIAHGGTPFAFFHSSLNFLAYR